MTGDAQEYPAAARAGPDAVAPDRRQVADELAHVSAVREESRAGRSGRRARRRSAAPAGPRRRDMTGNPADLTLSAAAAQLAAGSISAGELAAACLDRVVRQQPMFNTFLTVDAEGARAAAAASDARRARGEALGPLDGIPVAHKDLFDRTGRVTTAGGILLNDRIADEYGDCPRQAGRRRSRRDRHPRRLGVRCRRHGP